MPKNSIWNLLEIIRKGEHLFELVEAAMDSLIADSMFIGEQGVKPK